MLKINYKGYKISQGSSKHVAIFKDNKMMFHAECDIELSEQGLKQMLDWYLDLVEKVESDEQMAKWKCEICGNEFDNFHAQGFDNKIYCPLCYFKKENRELKNIINQIGFEPDEIAFLQQENAELKKQVEEWKQHLKCAKEMLDIQGQKGNYNYDEYMLGLYNGMEYIISLFETREPNYISGKDIKFINNKTQQKEFIDYMNKTIEELESDNVDDEEMKVYLIQRINTFREILQKYRSIIGCDKVE